MTQVLNYKYTTILDLTTDSTGTFDATVNSGTAQVTDVAATEAFGDTAHFDGTTSYVMTTLPTTLTDDSARTVAVWLYSTNDLTLERFFATSPGSGLCNFQKRDDNTISLQTLAFNMISTSLVPVNTWTHCAVTYDGSTTLKMYINGVLENTLSFAWDLSHANQLKYIGSSNASFLFNGNMVDFRIYDGALSDAEMTTLFGSGPDVPLNSSLDITPFSHFASLTWNPVATTYTITEDDVEVISDTTESSATRYNLTPNTSYTYKIFLDGSATEAVTTSITTSVVDAGAVSSILTHLSNDLSSLDPTTIADIDTLLLSTLVDSDIITSRLSDGTRNFSSDSTFIADSVTTNVVSGSYLMPFSTGGIPGQTTTITAPDSTSEIVTYDESFDEITVDSIAYNVGDTFILGNMKVSVFKID